MKVMENQIKHKKSMQINQKQSNIMTKQLLGFLCLAFFMVACGNESSSDTNSPQFT